MRVIGVVLLMMVVMGSQRELFEIHEIREKVEEG